MAQVMAIRDDLGKMTDAEFIIYLKGYIPTGCKADAGTDFNLRQVHIMIEKHFEYMGDE